MAAYGMTAQDRYESLRDERNPYLDRARQASRLTLPALIPEEGDNAATQLDQNFQSIGARGVNHLAAKLLLALMPPGRSFFRLDIDEYVEEALAGEAGASFAEAKSEFEEALVRIEKTAMAKLEQSGARATITEVLKHLLVGGNALLQVRKNGKLKMHPLSAYVVKRDKEGLVLDIVVKETTARTALPEAIREMLDDAEVDVPLEDDSGRDDVDIYTRITRKEKKWEIYQEVAEKTIPGTEGTYPLDKTPWIPLRFTKIDGEDYGRGFVEDYIGDIRSAEGLNKAVVMFAAASSKIVFFLQDQGYITRTQLAEAESGDVLDGDADAVSVLQLEKFPDFRTADAVLQRVEGRLEQVFLLFSGVQRDAERVTAQEIRAMIEELEQALGGVYSGLAEEMQAPLARVLLHQLQKNDEIPPLPEESVQTKIITGVDALGRTSDLRRLDAFIVGLAETFGPEAINQRVNLAEYAARRANALSLDISGLVKSDEQVQQEREAAMQEQIATEVAPEAARAELQNQQGVS